MSELHANDETVRSVWCFDESWPGEFNPHAAERFDAWLAKVKEDAREAGRREGQIERLRHGIQSFRYAWKQWGDVNDLHHAEALETELAELERSDAGHAG